MSTIVTTKCRNECIHWFYILRPYISPESHCIAFMFCLSNSQGHLFLAQPVLIRPVGRGWMRCIHGDLLWVHSQPGQIHVVQISLQFNSRWQTRLRRTLWYESIRAGHPVTTGFWALLWLHILDDTVHQTQVLISFNAKGGGRRIW